MLYAPADAARIVGSVARPAMPALAIALPTVTSPLLRSFSNNRVGALSPTPSGAFGILSTPGGRSFSVPAELQSTVALPESAQSAAFSAAAPDGPRTIRESRVSQPAKKAINEVLKSFAPGAAPQGHRPSFDAAFDGSTEKAVSAREEADFAAKASWVLGRTADELGAAKGQKSGKMSTHDFVRLLREAQEEFAKTYWDRAPTEPSYRAALAVNESIVRIIAAVGRKDEPLHNQIRRMLSVWQIFNEAMTEAAERGTIGDVIGEAKLFAHQVEASVATSVPLKTTENGIVETEDVDEGLKALRDASHPIEPNIVDLLNRISEHHPGLALNAERVFLIKDQSMLDMLDLPSDAAGAARVLSDGKRQAPVIILVAPKGIAVDDFVEFVIHEAVHLMDGGILHVENSRALEHWLAEGYTQLRAHEMADESLERLGRHARKNPAYDQEVGLARAFISQYGTQALSELVEKGSSRGLETALGKRWAYVERLMRFESNSMTKRKNLLNALYAVVMTPDFGEEQFAYLVKHFGLR